MSLGNNLIWAAAKALSPTEQDRAWFRGQKKAPPAAPAGTERRNGPGRPRRAAVAMVLRLELVSSDRPKFPSVDSLISHIASAREAVPARGGSELGTETLLIRRAVNQRDPWSGHVALPGGRQEWGEEDLETAVRECEEEVGAKLKPGRFALLGRLRERRTSRGDKGLAVSCLVFVQLDYSSEVVLTPDPKEVAHAWHSPQTVGHPLHKYFPAARKTPWKFLAWILGVDTVFFPCFYLPPAIPPPHQAVPEEESNGAEAAVVAAAQGKGAGAAANACVGFVLWGLTFGMVSDLVVAAGAPPFARPPPYFMFRNPVANLLLAWWYCCLDPLLRSLSRSLGQSSTHSRRELE